MKIHGLLHKFSAQMPIFGQICSKTANLTPDLGDNLHFHGRLCQHELQYNGKSMGNLHSSIICDTCGRDFLRWPRLRIATQLPPEREQCDMECNLHIERSVASVPVPIRGGELPVIEQQR